MVKLLARNVDGDFTNLDLSGDLTISLTKSVEEVQDITQRKGAYSKTFNIPGSDVNNKFFRGVFNVNATDFDSTLDTQCVVQDGGADIFNGTMRLNRIIKQGTNTSYEIYIVEDISPLSTLFKELNVCDLDFTDIEHEINYDNIVSTWTYTGGTYDNYSGLVGKVLYPLAHTGYDADSTYGTWDFSTSGFTNSGATAIQTTQFKPWVNLRYLMDKMFGETEFTFESEFMDTQYFRSIFMFAGQSPTMGATNLEDRPPNQNFFEVKETAGYYYSYDSLQSPKFIIFNQENYDYLNKYTLSTYPTVGGQTGARNYHTIVTPGTYQYRMDLRLFIVGTVYGPSYVDISLRDLDTGTIYDQIQGIPIPTTGIERTLFLNASGMTANTRIAPYIRLNSGGLQQDIGIDDATFRLYSSPTISITGATIDWTVNLPCNVSQLELFKNVISYFNLVVIPSGEKRFKIEPYVDYLDVRSGTTRDWTQKLNLDESYTIEPLDYDLKRTLNFTYTEDPSVGNVYFLNNFGKQMGDKTFYAPNNLLTDETDLDFIFQSLPTNTVDGAKDTDFIIPRFYERQEDGPQYQPMSSEPRLGFYTGNKYPISGDTSTSYTGITWYLQSGSTTVEQSTYPVISHMSILKENVLELSDLHINNAYDFFMGNTDLVEGETNNDVYNNFYDEYIEQLYSTEGRLFTGLFYLTPRDIADITFNDAVYFLNSQWRLLEIQDGDITEPTMVRCKFLKVPYRTENTTLIAPDYVEQNELPPPPGPSPTPSPTPTPSACLCLQTRVTNNSTQFGTFAYIDCNRNYQTVGLNSNQTSSYFCYCQGSLSLPLGFDRDVYTSCPTVTPTPSPSPTQGLSPTPSPTQGLSPTPTPTPSETPVTTFIYNVENCDNSSDTRIVQSTAFFAAGKVVKLFSPGCFEILGFTSGTPVDTITTSYNDCSSCPR